MYAKLDGIFSSDLPGGPLSLPEDPEDCWISIHADIGVAGKEGTDTFLFYVTTPKFLAKELSKEEYRFGKGLLILNNFDWNTAEKAIEKLASSTSGENWDEISNKLSCYGDWEFENYEETTS